VFKFEQNGTAVLKLQQKQELHKNQDGHQIFFFSFCHLVMNWCTKFGQDRYNHYKATAEIRLAQKTKWPPIFFFFRFVII